MVTKSLSIFQVLKYNRSAYSCPFIMRDWSLGSIFVSSRRVSFPVKSVSLNRKLEREMTVVTWNSWTPAEKKIFCQTPPRSRVAMLKHIERSVDWSDFVDTPGFQSLPVGHWDICAGFRLVDGPPRLQGLDPTRGSGGLIRIISILCRANGLGVRSPRYSF